MKTVLLTNGDTFVLPKGAVVTSVTVDGTIEVTSSCNNLPVPSPWKCWRFAWENVSTVYNDAFFTAIEIAGVKYPFTITPDDTYDNGGVWLPDEIQRILPAGMAKDFTTRGGTAVNPKCITFKLPAGLGTPLIYWQNSTLPGYPTSYLAMVPEADQCDCPQ